MSKMQLVIESAAELVAGNDPKNPKFTSLQAAPDELKDEVVKLYFSALPEREAISEFAEAVAESASWRHVQAIADSHQLGELISNDLYQHVENVIAEEVRQQVERLARQARKDTDTDSKIDQLQDKRSAA